MLACGVPQWSMLCTFECRLAGNGRKKVERTLAAFAKEEEAEEEIALWTLPETFDRRFLFTTILVERGTRKETFTLAAVSECRITLHFICTRRRFCTTKLTIRQAEKSVIDSECRKCKKTCPQNAGKLNLHLECRFTLGPPLYQMTHRSSALLVHIFLHFAAAFCALKTLKLVQIYLDPPFLALRPQQEMWTRKKYILYYLDRAVG